MKLTTLLLSASTVALASFFAALFVTHNALAAGGIFFALLVTLIVMRDYRTRDYFVVTAEGSTALRPLSVPHDPHLSVRNEAVALAS